MLETLKKYFTFKPLKPLIFLVDKPLGYSSFTIVDIFKSILKDKAGHAGTLDPLATGDLLILTGHTTKLTNLYINSNKEYKVTFLIGAKTPSYDLETTLELINPPAIKTSVLKEALQKLNKPTKLIITGFSAIKKAGKPLYKHKNKHKIQEEKLMQVLNIHKYNLHEITPSELMALFDKQKAQLLFNSQNYEKLVQEYQIPIRERQIRLFKNLIKKYEENILILKDSTNINKLYIAEMVMKVTKGTYIRSIAHYLATKLNLPITTIQIRRINSYN